MDGVRAVKLAHAAALAIVLAATAQSAIACEWTSLGQRRGAAERIVEGRVLSVRVARVWISDWRLQVEKVAIVQPVTTVRGQPLTSRFEYRFSTARQDFGDCSVRPDRSVEPEETGYFLFESARFPTLVLTPQEYRRVDLDG